MKKWTLLQKQTWILIPSIVVLVAFILIVSVLSMDDYRTGMMEEVDITGITESIRYYDEVLTMSANMAVLTGDARWEARYHGFIPLLDQSIQEAASHFASNEDHVVAIRGSNQDLIAMEEEAFYLIQAGKKDAAEALLFGTGYQEAKKTYSDNLTALTLHLKEHREEIRTNLERALFTTEAILLLLVLSVIGTLIAGFRAMANRFLGEKLTADISGRLLSSSNEETDHNIHWVLDRLVADAKGSHATLVRRGQEGMKERWDSNDSWMDDDSLPLLELAEYEPGSVESRKIALKDDSGSRLIAWVITETITTQDLLQLVLYVPKGRHSYTTTYRYILKSITEMLAQAIRQRLHEDQLYSLATQDALTGRSNRRHFLEILEREFNQHHRNGQPLTFLMLDLDLFKTINDTYGHGVGDLVIRKFAETTEECLRESDVLGRLGGEEFGVCLPNTTLDGAQEVAERIRIAVEHCGARFEDRAIHCTVSIGISSLTPEDRKKEELLKRGDQALYAAKAGGRNRVEIR